MEPGKRLGPYEIVSRIGAGGMGEVWRARDTRLDREVAIKILPAEFPADAKLKARFEREAKTISQLSHPNICTLFDVGENFIVMELLDGESLAHRVARGPLPASEVLRYGIQIAEALGNAHRAGIVHRDLKPGNIMLTKSGAKLLDFGLAKSTFVAPSIEEATAQMPLTAEGTIVGTFQYMAPEQLAGEEPDARTDIFALGAVLYEMATGRMAFEGKNRTSLIAAIVSGEPRPMRELQPLTPPALEHVVTKCLQKDRDDRWQSAADIAEEMRWISQTGSGSGVAAPITLRPKARESIAWSLAAIAVAVAGYLAWRTWTAQEPPVLRLTVSLPPGVTVDTNGEPVSISPDGKLIVFVAEERGKTRLWSRRTDRFDSQPLNGTESAVSPFFSPDGAWIGFVADGMLKKIATGGGAPVNICPVRDFRGGTWGRDGNIYFVPGSTEPLWKVPDSGGKPIQVSHLDPSRDESSQRWPQILPDGEHILVTTKTPQISSFDEGRIAVVSLSDGVTHTLIEGGMYGRFISSGHLVFARGNGLYAVKVDLKRMRVSGTPVLVLDNLFVNSGGGAAYYDVAANGSVVYMGRAAAEEYGLLWADRRGQTTLGSTGERNVVNPRVSPDGRTVAVEIFSANDDIGLVDLGRGMLTRLSFEPGNESSVVWSPDGLRVYYSSELPHGRRIMTRNADGTGASEEVLRSDNIVRPNSVSPDGRFLAYTELNPATGADIWFFSLVDRKRIVFLQSAFHEGMATFSPAGQLLAYQSNESGCPEIYVRSLSPGGGRWQVSLDGGSTPRWSRDGRELFYASKTRIQVVTIVAGRSLSLGKPQPVLATEQLPPSVRVTGTYDVAPDGRMVTTYASRRSDGSQLNVVTNWFEEVRHRTTSGR